LARLRGEVRSAGDLARFDYWLNTFRYLRAVAAVACARGALDESIERIAAAKDATQGRVLAQSEALPARVHLARSWEAMMTFLLAVTDTPGEMGTVANLEQASRCKLKFVDGHDKALADALGEPSLPEVANVSSRYQGDPRIIVPTQRGVVSTGETPMLKVIVLDNEPPGEALLFWRELGQGEFCSVPLRHVARGVHQVKLPEVPAGGAEYFIRVATAGGKDLVWPPTAPGLNFTVVEFPSP